MKIALIPAFNSQNTIADVIVRTKEFVDKIIVCNDGSKDNTAKIARALGAFVIYNKQNRGKGVALKRLFDQALKEKLVSPSVVITLDSDGQHFPEDIPSLVAPVLDNRADIVVGVRDKNDIPFYRVIGNVILDSLSGAGKGTLSGFRAYSFNCLKDIDVKIEGYGADTQILQDLKSKGKRIQYVPISIVYNEESHKKNFMSQFAEILDVLILNRPLLSLGLAGLVSFLAGLFGVVNVIRAWNLNRELALGTLLLSMTVLLLGALIFFVGILLHAIKKEMKMIRGLE